MSPEQQPYLSEFNGQQDLYYISTDPAENADNFDPKWQSFRQIKTNKEMYKAIRQRWGNSIVPDPKVNLTYRHINVTCQCESKGKEKCFSTTNNLNGKFPLSGHSRRNKQISKRKSRPITLTFEQQISNLQRNSKIEYSLLLKKQSNELELLQKAQYMQYFYFGLFNIDWNDKVNLEMQHKQDLMNLLSSQCNDIKNFLKNKNEAIEACRKNMEEVKSFFKFYQETNGETVMTAKQYLLTVETEKMYSLYPKFYA